MKNYCDMIAANAPLTIRSAKVSVREALKPERQRPSLKRLIEEMPDGGDDSDFERVRDFGRDIEF